MKKLFYTLIALIVVVVLIGVLTPAYFSSQNEKYLTQFFDQLAQLTHGKIKAKVTENQRHWFYADSKISMQIANEGSINGFNGPIDLNLDARTTFGPFIFYHQNNNMRLAVGRFLTQFTLTKITSIPGIEGKYLTSANVKATLMGAYKIQIQGAPLKFTVKNTIQNPKIIQESKLEINFPGSQSDIIISRNFKRVYAHTDVSKITGEFAIDQTIDGKQTSHQAKFSVQAIQYNQDLRKVAPYVWTGNENFTIPIFALQSKDLNIVYTNIKLNITMHNTAQKLNADINFNIPYINVNGNKGKFTFVTKVKNLNAEIFTKLMQQLETMAQQQQSFNDFHSQMPQIAANFINIFGREAKLNLKTNLSFDKYGFVDLNTSLENDVGGLTNFKFDYKQKVKNNPYVGPIDTNLHFNIEGIHTQSLGIVLHKVLQNFQRLPQESVLEQIPQLFTKDSRLNLRLSFSGANFGNVNFVDANAYLKNYQQQSFQGLWDNAQINVKWQVPVVWITMLRNMNPAVLKEIQQQENTNVANEVIVAFKMFQDQFPKLVEGKYIVQNGDLYESEWNINKNQFLINNQPLAKLVAEFYNNQQNKVQGQVQIQIQTPAQSPDQNKPQQLNQIQSQQQSMLEDVIPAIVFATA